MSRILVLGGTGAFGTYLVGELLAAGNRVDVVSLDDVVSGDERLRYIKADAKEIPFLQRLLAENYDAIVDFMVYYKSEFRQRYEMLLGAADHYVFLSTYRVYAQSNGPLTESSPRLLDVMTDPAYLAEDEYEYALYKAREEDMLQESSRRNWTILRPSITYSKRRFQLVTLEANTLIPRARQGKAVLLPEEALDRQTTMTWAGDAAKMMAAIVKNERAYGETYTIATAEHHTWREVARMYEEICGLKYHAVDTETYLRIWGAGSRYARFQLLYDRLFERIIDNRKILSISGLRQSEFTPLGEGLRKELSALPETVDFGKSEAGERMDQYLQSKEG